MSPQTVLLPGLPQSHGLSEDSDKRLPIRCQVTLSSLRCSGPWWVTVRVVGSVFLMPTQRMGRVEGGGLG